MVNLNWEGKNTLKDKLNREIERESNNKELESIYIPNLLKKKHGKDDIKNDKIKKSTISKEKWTNRLIWGDNLNVLSKLMNEFRQSIELIYIDPPFFSGGNYYHKIFIGKGKKYIKNLAYNDKWENNLSSYLNFIYARLILMKELLKPEGSIYLHIDWHVSHYIKLLLDDLFGKENFRNEIIWAYPAASAQTRRFFIRSYDTILFYTKSDDYLFNDDPAIYMEYSDRVKNNLKTDERGTFYYRGGSHDGKKLSRKVYVNESGIFPRDVWKDIPYLRANTKTYQGFSTQKPERLLKRIILASSNPKSLVADFFSGSGSTIAAAEKLNRKWIAVDNNWFSIHTTMKRLLSINKSNDLMNWNKKYRKEAKPFKVIYLLNKQTQDRIPDSFLKKDKIYENARNNLKNPEVYLDIVKGDNSISIKIIDFQFKDESVFSKKTLNRIKSWEDWVDFISVDFNYNGKRMIPNWVSYKLPKKRSIKLQIPKYEYSKPGNYEVLVKIVDILGNELTQKIYIDV
ncbi:MAG: hypothetical protein GF317_14675 [Candidatus Lokiarchaeota archaeon]|nr:hypothetical protein [Candidatus Lokiarchaeota archaeon]MBD3200852.1 hypothetical protein [Candidatus Lokiarchaeota archaeon]